MRGGDKNTTKNIIHNAVIPSIDYFGNVRLVENAGNGVKLELLYNKRKGEVVSLTKNQWKESYIPPQSGGRRGKTHKPRKHSTKKRKTRRHH